MKSIFLMLLISLFLTGCVSSPSQESDDRIVELSQMLKKIDENNTVANKNLVTQPISPGYEKLMFQISQCWDFKKEIFDNVGPNDKPVLIKLEINPDRTVKSATVIDTERYKNDKKFRKIANSALDTFKNPGCRTLNLPRNQYNAWRHSTITFDPKVY